MDFIPLIENTPLSDLITYRVGELVGQELGPWLRKQEDIQIGINVTTETLGRGSLSAACLTFGLGDILDKLMLEINERGLPDSLPMKALKLATSKKMKIAADDVNINDTNLLIMMRARPKILQRQLYG